MLQSQNENKDPEKGKEKLRLSRKTGYSILIILSLTLILLYNWNAIKQLPEKNKISDNEKDDIFTLESFIIPAQDTEKLDTLASNDNKNTDCKKSSSPKSKVHSLHNIKLTRKLETYKDSNGLYGIRNCETKIICIEPQFDQIRQYEEGSRTYWKVVKDGKYGLINVEGYLLPPIYDNIEHMFQYMEVEPYPYLVVEKDGKSGLYNIEKKKVLLPSEYLRIRGKGKTTNKEGKAIAEYLEVVSKKGMGLMRISDMKLILPYEYYDINVWNNTFIVKKNNLYGVVNNENKVIIPIRYTNLPIYNNIHDTVYFKIAENIFEAYNSRGYRIIELSEAKKLKYIKFDTSIFTNADGKQGLKDLNGKTLIKAQYDYLFPVNVENKTLFIAYKDSLYGVINTNNKTIVPFIYSYISAINSLYDTSIDSKIMTHLIVYKGELCGLMNINRLEMTVPIEYKYIELATSDFLWVNKDKLYGIVDINNNIIAPINSQWIPKTYPGVKEEDSVIRILSEDRRNNIYYNSKGIVTDSD